MRERFRLRQPKVKPHQRWVIGAIVTPVFLGMVGGLWLLPDRRVRAEEDPLARNERTTLSQPHRESLVSSMGTIAMVAGGVFLLLNSRVANRNAETADLSGADLSGANFCEADFCGADFCGADLSGANLNGADLNGAKFRYANLNGVDLRYANLSGADLNCALLTGANFSDANLSGALLFYLNSREVLNLEPLQLEKEPSPFLCNVALPAYAHQPGVNPNRDCDRIPYLLSARYDISLEEAQGIVDEARQHRWD